MIETKVLTDLPVDLGGGLIMRQARRSDLDDLAAFNGRIHGSDPEDAEMVAAWTRDLLDGSHPRVRPADFTLVEDQAGKIVSSLCLISQTWSYGGIPFGVGRPELVGTDPDLRGRGLIRRQFQVVHEWSRKRGELLQIITGIPYYYRQYGYEMALELQGSRTVTENMIPPLKPDQQEVYSIRPVRPDEIGQVMACAEPVSRRNTLTCLRDAEAWRYEVWGRSQGDINRLDFFLIEDEQGQVVGMLGVPPTMWKTTQSLAFFELKPGNSYLMVTPAVLRWLWALGQSRSSETYRCQALNLRLGRRHPAYSGFNYNLSADTRAYAYYVRVADVVAFLNHIRPVLEQRLAELACAGQSGEYTIGFYRTGFRLTLQKGRITLIEPATLYWEQYQAKFPDLTFLQLLFQYRSFNELRDQYPDVNAFWDVQSILDALFPKTFSNVWALS